MDPLTTLVKLIIDHWETVLGVAGSIGASLLAIRNRLTKVDSLEVTVTSRLEEIESRLDDYDSHRTETEIKMSKLDDLWSKLDKMEKTLDTYVRKEETIIRAIGKIDQIEREVIGISTKLDMLRKDGSKAE
jgi:chromosome segregation ATPase